jgi:hypothetical protein
MNALSAALHDQSQRMSQLAHHLASEGHARISNAVLFHAAALAVHATTTRGLEAQLATALAHLSGARAALAQSRATTAQLQAELLDEATLPPADPGHAARQRTIDTLKARLPRVIR